MHVESFVVRIVGKRAQDVGMASKEGGGGTLTSVSVVNHKACPCHVDSDLMPSECK